jgi:hypothetical protein
LVIWTGKSGFAVRLLSRSFAALRFDRQATGVTGAIFAGLFADRVAVARAILVTGHPV